MEENPYQSPLESGDRNAANTRMRLISCLWWIGLPIFIVPFIFMLDSAPGQLGKGIRDFGVMLLQWGLTGWLMALTIAYLWPHRSR